MIRRDSHLLNVCHFVAAFSFCAMYHNIAEFFLLWWCFLFCVHFWISVGAHIGRCDDYWFKRRPFNAASFFCAMCHVCADVSVPWSCFFFVHVWISFGVQVSQADNHSLTNCLFIAITSFCAMYVAFADICALWRSYFAFMFALVVLRKWVSLIIIREVGFTSLRSLVHVEYVMSSLIVMFYDGAFFSRSCLD